jgi:hypothetical protein
VVGIDANFRFFKSLSVNMFGARSDTPGVSTNQNSAKVSIGWEDSSKRLQTSIMTVGEGFRDDMGFVRRLGVTRQFYDAAWLPRPQALRRYGMRQLEPHGRIWNYYDTHGELVTRQGHVGNQVTFENGSYFEYAFEPRVEMIAKPFTIAPGVVIPPGRYDWKQHLAVLDLDHSKPLSATVRSTFGDFWSGTQKTLQVSLLFRPTYRFVLDMGLQVSDIALQIPDKQFTTSLLTLRTGYSFSTNVFLDSLLQYRNDVHQFSANVRFNLIHRPLSDFFIVYNESQYTQIDQPAGRGVVVKYTQMFAF